MENMAIVKGDAIKNLVLYPLAKPSLPIVKIHKHPPAYLEENICSPLTVAKALEFKNQTEDDTINNFINQPATAENVKCQMLKEMIDNKIHEDLLRDNDDQHIPTNAVHNRRPIEIELGKILNINGNLNNDQQQKLIKVLQKYKGYFAWDYSDMKGINPQMCTHHIYTKKYARPIRQPQQRLNPHLKYRQGGISC